MTLEVTRLLGVMAIADPVRGKMHPAGAGFQFAQGVTGQHREGYTHADAQVVVDWLNGRDQPLPGTMVHRRADPMDPRVRQGMRRVSNGVCEWPLNNVQCSPRLGIAPLP